MNTYTANYSNTNHNFVIQNLLGKTVSNEYLPALCVIKNILQRGCPTTPSKFIRLKIGEIDFTKHFPLISKAAPKWERMIRGDKKNNYYPAQTFFDSLIPKHFPQFPFFRQLLIPELPINVITQIEVAEFEHQQVDFYVPHAFLVIEIDGAQHDATIDSNRDRHLAKFGIKTVRITTAELESENESFRQKVSIIRERIEQVSILQEEKKKTNTGLFSFNDYKLAVTASPDLDDPVYVATSLARFQILLLDLLRTGRLTFNNDWELAVFCEEQSSFEDIACEDLFRWFGNLFRLQRIPFIKPKVIITRVQSFEELKSSQAPVRIDFSLTKRYTDEFQNHPEILFVRTGYLDHYRYYKNTNAANPEYIDLEPFNHFRMSTCPPVSYKIKIGDRWKPESALLFFLENIFGYDKFFPGQLPIIVNALSRNDTIGLLPTGGGKSVCYQLAALLQPAISFVVCPIKSLMYDQKQDLDSIQFTRVNYITSDDDGETKEKTMKEFSQGKFFFIFISPERFQIQSFRQYLLSVNQNHSIAYAVIDEVHCLSEWGHDFRTSYLNLAKTIQQHCNNYKFIGLTATASINVLKDVQIEFGIKPENVKTLTDYTRKELEFEIINDRDSKLKEIKSLLADLNDSEHVLVPQGEDSRCGIIFTPVVNGSKGCYALAAALEQEFRTPVKFYSGQVPSVNKRDIMPADQFDEYKKQVQIQFKKNDFTLLAATKAFGMGVNKRNIHYTVHFGIPGSMESLYQEAGRAGRDKDRFASEPAKCLVLFTKTTDQESLQRVWNRETSLSKLIETLPQIDGDINTNLFLFKSGLDTIRDEYELICALISRYAIPFQKKVRVSARQLGTSKSRTEKAIYRLMQLGIAEDWIVNNFITGEFEVDFAGFSDESIKKNLKSTINKYDKSFDFNSLQEDEKYQPYEKIWRKEASLRDRCIVLLLQWAYNHFAYNRRQSLKNIYENCDKYVSGRLNKAEFKQQLENYFRFSEVSYLLQHIAENPDDFYRWFEVFYQIDDNIVSDRIINWEQRQSLLANVSRFLESYEYNTGLDFTSGMLRLLVNDFENADGRNRFETSFKQIMRYQQKDIDFIISRLLQIGSVMSGESKTQLALSVLAFFPGDSKMLKRIQEVLEDEHTTGVLLSDLSSRVTRANENIYAELIKIG